MYVLSANIALSAQTANLNSDITLKQQIKNSLKRLSSSIKEHGTYIGLEDWEICDKTVFCEYENNVISKTTSKPVTGIVVKLDKTGEYSSKPTNYIRWKCSYINGKRDGIFREYSKGKLLSEKNYKDGELDGISKNFMVGYTETEYAKGVILHSKQYSTQTLGQEVVIEKKYENGRLSYSVTKRNNKKFEENFYENGEIVKSKTYYDSGKIFKEMIWKNSQIVKTINYYENGKSWVTY